MLFRSNADGAHESSGERYLTPAPAEEPIKVGDRVRMLADDPLVRTGEFVGKVGRVSGISGGSNRVPISVVFDISS